MSGGVLGRGSSRYDSWFMNILCISIFAGPGNFLAHHCSAGQRQLWRVSSHDDGAGIQLSSRPRLLKSWRLSLVGCGNIYIKSFQILVLYSIDIWSLTPQAWVPGLGTQFWPNQTTVFTRARNWKTKVQNFSCSTLNPFPFHPSYYDELQLYMS